MCNGTPCPINPKSLNEYFIAENHYIYGHHPPDDIKTKSTEVCKRKRAYFRLIAYTPMIDNTGGIIYRMKCGLCGEDHFNYEINRKVIEE